MTNYLQQIANDLTASGVCRDFWDVELEMIARGSGFHHAVAVDTLDSFRAALSDALAAQERWFICARVSPDSAI